MFVLLPVGVINITENPCCIGRGLAALIPKDKNLSFLFYTLKYLDKTFEVYNGEGTVFGSINNDSLNNLDIIIPSKSEIENFEKRVSKFDSEISINEHEISKLTKLKALLITQLSKEKDKKWKIV